MPSHVLQPGESASPTRARWLPALFVLNLLTLAVSTWAIVTARHAERAAYERVVSDVWSAVEPVYADFGLKRPPTAPNTVAEILKPLFENLQSPAKP